MTLTREAPRNGPPTPQGWWFLVGAFVLSATLIVLAFLPFCGAP